MPRPVLFLVLPCAVLAGFFAPLPAPAATMLLVDSFTESLYRVNPSTAEVTLVGAHGGGFVVGGMAYDAFGDTLYATTTDTDSLYRLDPATGVATLVGPLGVGNVFMHGLAFDATSRKLFATYGGIGSNDLYDVNLSTGAATRIGPIGTFHGDADLHVSGLDVHPVTGDLYGGLHGNGNTHGLVRIDKSTGAGSLVGTSPPMTGLAFDPATGVLYGVNNGLAGGSSDGPLYRLDPATGAATAVGVPGVGNALSIVFIPEPAGAAVLLAAGVGVMYRPRCERRP